MKRLIVLAAVLAGCGRAEPYPRLAFGSTATVYWKGHDTAPVEWVDGEDGTWMPVAVGTRVRVVDDEGANEKTDRLVRVTFQGGRWDGRAAKFHRHLLRAD